MCVCVFVCFFCWPAASITPKLFWAAAYPCSAARRNQTKAWDWFFVQFSPTSKCMAKRCCKDAEPNSAPCRHQRSALYKNYKYVTSSEMHKFHCVCVWLQDLILITCYHFSMSFLCEEPGSAIPFITGNASHEPLRSHCFGQGIPPIALPLQGHPDILWMLQPSTIKNPQGSYQSLSWSLSFLKKKPGHGSFPTPLIKNN